MLLELLSGVTGVFVVVYDGQHGLKFTLGRAQCVVGPGVHFKWPIIQNIRVEATKHTTLDLAPQIIQLADDLVYEVDAKVLYRIRDLRKALIEVDELVTAMQNRVVLAIQRVVSAQTRATITDTDGMVSQILADLVQMETQWGIEILQLGFSNLSPSPATLEITQLDLLARERHALFEELCGRGVPDDVAVALVTGAVVATHPAQREPGMIDEQRALAKVRADAEIEYEQNEAEQQRKAKLRRDRNAPNPGGRLVDPPADDEKESDDPPTSERR